MNEYVEMEIENMKCEGRLTETKKYIQHGPYSVYDHCVRVSELSIEIQKWIKIPVNERSLVRGALLHDYFLYDWHDSKNGHHMHGFTHPKTALDNATRDYNLTSVEKDIILHHMFPLTLIPPKHVEGWIVCAADKICAIEETLEPYMEKVSRKELI